MRDAEISLGLGCTSCDPTTLSSQLDLPDDADELLDRPEYWIVYKNVFAKNSASSHANSTSGSSHHHVSLADELCFRLDDKTGNVHFYINSTLVNECLFSVDITQKLWFFFYLNGKINAIRLIPSCNSTTQLEVTELLRSQANLQATADQSSTSGLSPNRRNTRPNSALIDYYKSQIVSSPVENSNQRTAAVAPCSNNASKLNYNQEECKVCWNAPIECVLYSCGHMCLCWNW